MRFIIILYVLCNCYSVFASENAWDMSCKNPMHVSRDGKYIYILEKYSEILSRYDVNTGSPEFLEKIENSKYRSFSFLGSSLKGKIYLLPSPN